MSLGLFNCRLIQPAGDQLFFCAGCLASSGKLCSVSLSHILLGPDQREGAACFLFFLLRRVLFGFSKGAKPPSGAGDSHRFSYEFPRRSSILPIDSATEPNIQPWEFVAVTEPAMLRAIAGVADFGRFIAQAAVCVVVLCKDTKYYLEDG